MHLVRLSCDGDERYAAGKFVPSRFWPQDGLEVAVEEDCVLLLHPFDGAQVLDRPVRGGRRRREANHGQEEHSRAVVVRLAGDEAGPAGDAADAVAVALLVGVARRPRRHVHLNCRAHAVKFQAF